MADALGGLFQTFINWLYSRGEISVPEDFHERCKKVHELVDDDIMGIVNTLLGYSIDSASDVNYHVECDNETLEKLLNIWLSKINIDIQGVPTGIQELSKEYFRERWEGSSFCVLRYKNWETITADGVTIKVPTTLWFANGSSVYVGRKDEKNYKLGTDEYYLDEALKNKIPVDNKEGIIIQKPFNRWFSKYPTPYLVKKGVLKNWLAMKVLQGKSDEVISKVLPYLFTMKKGTEAMWKDNVTYDDKELTAAVNNLKSQLEKYINQMDKTPINGIPFDQSYEHVIPDLTKILSEELYRQGYRAVLGGLGFVDMIEISPSRQESRLNPKPFISEVNAGVKGFKSMLLDIIYQISLVNKKEHGKLFSENNKILVVNSRLQINVEQMLDYIRSGFDRGVASIQTYQEWLGLDPDTEKERRLKEAKEGDEDLFYPHLVTNQEGKGKDTILPAKPKKKDNEKEGKEPGSPEAENYKNAELQLEIAPYQKDNPPEFLKKYPKGAQEVFIEVFNKNYPKGEDYAFPVAWTALKRWLKKNGYKKVGDKWVKSEEKNNG